MKKEKHSISNCSIPAAGTLLKFFFLLPLLFLQIKSMAQVSSVIDASVSIEENSSNSNSLDGTFTIVIADTNNVSNVEVMMGTSFNTPDDILSRVFLYDSQAGLPSGFSYSRSANKITLAVGSYAEKSTYFCRVRIQDNTGQWALPLQFITN